jgi:hypothetical protein
MEPMQLGSWLAQEKGRCLLELASLENLPVLLTDERARIESLEARLALLDDQIEETLRDNYERRNR